MSSVLPKSLDDEDSKSSLSNSNVFSFSILEMCTLLTQPVNHSLIPISLNSSLQIYSIQFLTKTFLLPFAQMSLISIFTDALLYFQVISLPDL